MKRRIHTLLLVMLVSTGASAQTSPVKITYDENITPINLKSAVEQGLRKNHDEEIRRFDRQLLDLDYKDDRDEFWLPNIKMELTTTDDRLGHLLSQNRDASYNTPAGVMALNLGEYTLFNWGKDYLKFLNQKSDYKRSSSKLSEDRRDLKHNVMLKYLELVTANEILRFKKTQLRHASFIFRFNYDKAKQRKVSRQQFYQSKSVYLHSQEEYHLAKSNVEQLDRELSYLINDTVQTRYRLTEQIKFQRIKGSLNDLLEKGIKRSTNILDAKNNVVTSDREYQIAKKENLPLPKVSLKLGAYKYQFDDNNSDTKYQNSLGSDGVDLVASINASWTLTGRSGLLNGRRTKRAVLNRNRAMRQLSQYRHNTQNTIKSLYKLAIFYERKHNILQTDVQTLRSSFDVILDNYTTKKTPFLNFKDILEDSTQREIDLVMNKYEHARTKILLARNCGLEDLPGENLEQLTEFRQE
ncbi:MAG: TolC family protein [Bacteriovoracaceae bacterium]|nr:TolC family protein [Bacteriovoracaceae bacterium]